MKKTKRRRYVAATAHELIAKPTCFWRCLRVMHKVPVRTLFTNTIKGEQTTLQGIIQSSSFFRNTQNPLNSSSKSKSLENFTTLILKSQLLA